MHRDGTVERHGLHVHGDGHQRRGNRPIIRRVPSGYAKYDALCADLSYGFHSGGSRERNDEFDSSYVGAGYADCGHQRRQWPWWRWWICDHQLLGGVLLELGFDVVDRGDGDRSEHDVHRSDHRHDV